ncbi:Cytochrome C, partial [Durusdinium trenchii]
MRIAQRYETDGKYEIAYRLYHRALSYEPRNIQAQQKLKLMAQQLEQPSAQPAQPQPASPTSVNAQELLAAIDAKRPAPTRPTPAAASAEQPTIAKAAAKDDAVSRVDAAEAKSLRPAATPAVAARQRLLPAAVNEASQPATAKQPEKKPEATIAASPEKSEETLPRIRPAGQPSVETPASAVAKRPESSDWWSDVFAEDLPSTEPVALTDTPATEAVPADEPVETPLPATEIASTSELVQEALLGDLEMSPATETVDVREQEPTVAEPTTEEASVLADSADVETLNDPESVDVAGNWSATSLRRLCGELPAQLELIVKQLESDSREVKVSALDDLARLKSKAAPAALAIRAMLNDEDEHVQVAAAGALWEVERDSWDSVKTLRAGLKSDDPRSPTAIGITERFEILDRVHRFRTDLAEQVCRELDKALKFALHDDEPDVRAAAALSLGGLGEEGGIAIADLEYAALFDAPEVRDAAVTALASLLEERSVSRLDPVESALDATEVLDRSRLLPGFDISLFASEPAVSQPIGMAFDGKGRLWVAQCHSYRMHRVGGERDDEVVVLEDRDGDGVHDHRTVFLTGLQKLSGIEVGWGGVWLCAAPNLLFVPDADCDLIPDGPPVVVLDGWDTGPWFAWHLPNHLTWGPDGFLYGCSGYSSDSHPRSLRDGSAAPMDAGVWRVHPRTHRFEVVARGTCNPWGLDFDSMGRMFVSNNVVDHLWHLTPGGHYDRGEEADPPHVYEPMESCVDHVHWEGADQWDSIGDDRMGGHAHAGLLIYQGGAWPAAYDGVALMGNIHGNRICCDAFLPGNPHPIATHRPDLLRMDDPGFRCVDIQCGFDGQVYCCDWSATGECHSTDADGTGRIYRVTQGEVPAGMVDLLSATDAELLDSQESENEVIARRARIRLHYLASQNPVGDRFAQEVWYRACDPARTTDVRLRYLWTWSGLTGSRDSARLLTLMDDPDPVVAGWAGRLAVDLDGGTPEIADRVGVLLQQTLEESLLYELISLTRTFPVARRRTLLPSIVARLSEGASRDCQRLAWYALEPVLVDDPATFASILGERSVPFLQYAAIRRITELWVENNGEELLEPLKEFSKLESLADELVRERIRGWADGMYGCDREPPAAWLRTLDSLTKHPNRQVRELVATLPWTQSMWLDGGEGTLEEAVRIVKGDDAPLAQRLALLNALIAKLGRTSRAIDTLSSLIDSDSIEIRLNTFRALSEVRDPRVPHLLLERAANWEGTDQLGAFEVLSSRRDLAELLLDAIDSEQISGGAVPAHLARRMSNLDGGQLADRVQSSWGTITATPESLRAEMVRVSEIVDQTPSGSDRLEQGRRVFAERCSGCHVFKRFQKGWGPKLDGRRNVPLPDW